MSEMKERIVFGSRGSELALWQTNWVKAELEKRFPNIEIEVVIIKTTGDKILDSPLSSIGDKGLFTKELEQALLDGHIDLAVHSLKDIPTKLPAGLTIGAVTKREDVHDVFVSHPKKNQQTINKLPEGAVVATGSLRRKCQLLSWRPDLHIVDIRGNLSTRLRKLDESDWDGMILARAGLRRLGLEARIVEVISFDRMLPAVGQGALAVEMRDGDRRIRRIVNAIDHSITSIVTAAERAFLRYLEGGCQVPIGTYGRIENNEFHLDAMIGSVDGKKTVRGSIHGPMDRAELFATQLAQTLLEGGGREILDLIRRKTPAEIPSV